MAGSRLPHFGTIFSRVTGLVESGAVKEVPLWYAVYKKFPPPLEPFSDRPIPPQDPVLEIVFPEDAERATQGRKLPMSSVVKSNAPVSHRDRNATTKDGVNKQIAELVAKFD